MILNLKLVKIDSKYCDYLRQFDDRVMYNVNEKELRPFVGILFKVNQFEYNFHLTTIIVHLIIFDIFFQIKLSYHYLNLLTHNYFLI